MIGDGVQAGFHGVFPSLTDLDDGDQKPTTDFRPVYASVMEEWMGISDSSTLPKGTFPR